MAKSKTIFVCSECGYESPKWMGKCPACNQWNTFYEEKKINSSVSTNTLKRKEISKPVELNKIEGKIETPKLLKANLREYQKIGVQWLRTLSSYGLGRDSC